MAPPPSSSHHNQLGCKDRGRWLFQPLIFLHEPQAILFFFPMCFLTLGLQPNLFHTKKIPNKQNKTKKTNKTAQLCNGPSHFCHHLLLKGRLSCLERGKKNPMISQVAKKINVRNVHIKNRENDKRIRAHKRFFSACSSPHHHQTKTPVSLRGLYTSSPSHRTNHLLTYSINFNVNNILTKQTSPNFLD